MAGTNLARVAAPVRKGEELELRIDSLAYGGNGVGRSDGFVVFARGGLPGDLVRARVTKVKRGFAEGVADGGVCGHGTCSSRSDAEDEVNAAASRLATS